jgi:hypothetical protein
MGRKAGGKDFSPRVRSLFDIAIRESLADGTLLSKLKEQLRDDPVGTMQKMAGYAPKQVDMTLEQTVLLDTTQLTTDVLNTMFAAKEADEHNQGTDTAVH